MATPQFSAVQKLATPQIEKTKEAISVLGISNKIDVTLLGLHSELVRAFEFFNKKHFEGKLTPVAFSFHPQPSNGSRLGHYWVGRYDTRATNEEGNRVFVPEIIIYADLCLKAGPQQVFQTLLHEMVHHWQHLHGKPGKGNHHNREFHAKMKDVDLLSTGPKGYTKPTPAFEAALQNEFKPRVELIPFRRAAARRKGKMRKWVCLLCRPSYTIRVGRKEVRIKCMDCGTMFRKVE